MLLGDNGCGKSTALRAIVYGLLAELFPSEGVAARRNVRRSVEAARVALTLHNKYLRQRFTTEITRRYESEILSANEPEAVERLPVEATNLASNEEFTPKQSSLYDPRSRHYFLVGYGAMRRVAYGAEYKPELRTRRYGLRVQRVMSLLGAEESWELVPLSAWFPDLPEPRREEIRAILRGVLPREVELLDHLIGAELAVRFDGQELAFSDLSDGYKAHLGWICDLLYHVHVLGPDQPLAKLHGVVLVDEIDLHLHPSWQRTVLKGVARALPNLQLIVTTHSPLVIGGLPRENLRYLELGPDGTGLREITRNTRGLTADQLLLGEPFGLSSTRDPEADQRLAEAARAAATSPEAMLRYHRMLRYGIEEGP